MADYQSGYPLFFYGSTPANLSLEQIAHQFQRHLAHANSRHQLPADIESFTGRSTEIRRILSLVEQGVRENRTSTMIISITGEPGVGKTALAIHLAHQLKSYFSQAQLYVDFRGTEQQRRSLSEILASLLHACNIDPRSIPNDILERSQQFRSFLANKQTVLVLNDVTDVSQLHLLIPQEAYCVAFVTSRQPLAELPNATVLELEKLSPPIANELLHKLINRALIDLIPEATQQIVRCCDGLPLSLYLVAGAIKNQSPETFITYFQQLQVESDRIRHLPLSYGTVRPGFTLSYRQLREQPARLLRLLGLLTETHIDVTMAAALLELDPDSTRQVIGQLADLKLVKRIGGEYYQIIHDIVRLLARGQLASEDSPEARQAARLRLSRWYLHASQIVQMGLNPNTSLSLAQVINKSKRPPLRQVEQQIAANALNWFEFERLNLLAAAEWAFQAEDWPMVIAFAESLIPFWHEYEHWADGEQGCHRALIAARHLGDRLKEAQSLNNLANLYLRQGKLDHAKVQYKQGLMIAIDLNQPASAAKILANLGLLFMQQGDIQTASQQWQEALDRLSHHATDQKLLSQWMQSTDPILWQKACGQPDDRSATGLFGAMKNTLKRLISE